MKSRIEKDSLGEVEIPQEAYYGIYTYRNKESFQITKRGISKQMVKSLAIVKKACAFANFECGLLTKQEYEAISLSCDEIINGRLHGQFVTDLIQGGGGLGINMNANEVICNRANEMLGGEKGKYQYLDPVKHLNMNQSTNEVIMTAGKITCHKLVKKLLVEGKKLLNSFSDKEKTLQELIDNRIKNSLDITDYELLLEEFDSIIFGLDKALKKVEVSLTGLLDIALGYTRPENKDLQQFFMERVCKHLKKYALDNYKQSKSLLDSTRNFEGFVNLSSSIKGLATNLAKTANDIRILVRNDMGAESILHLPQTQAASNSVYETTYPVVLDMMNQVSFYSIGSDVMVTLASEGNQLDFNIYAPLLLSQLFENVTYVRRAMRTLREIGIEGITFKEN